jgi:hypothetical protein
MFQIGDLVKRGVDYGFITKVSKDKFYVRWFYLSEIEMGPYNTCDNAVKKMNT